MTDEEFLVQLKRHEGNIPYAYKDSLGYLTIGVGFLIDKRKGGGLRPEEIDFILKNRLDHVALELHQKLPWIDQLTPNRQYVLLNMAWNLGVDGLLEFKNTLSKIKAGDYEGGARGMLNSKWATQVDPIRGDNKGRADELAEQMRKG